MNQKIAYVRVGKSSYSNIRVREMLEQAFPEYHVKDINVIDLLKRNRFIILLNMLYIVKEYGFEIISGRRSIKRSFFATSYMLKRMRELTVAELSKDKYIFSLHNNAAFDASTHDFPAFIYTDFTLLANLYFRDFDKNLLSTKLFNMRIRLQEDAYKNARLIFTRSPYISKSFIDHYNIQPERVVCVYYGYNAPISNHMMNNDDYKNKNILLVGVDWRRKGGPELVEAFKIVLRRHPDARLTIVGCSPDVDVPNCNIVGRVHLSEVSKYYQAASVFCLPTKREGSAIVIIEALMSKLPIITTNIGSNPDMIFDGENGYLVEPGDVKTLANRLIDLLENPDRCKAFGEKGYSIAKDRYSWQKVGERIRENIEPLLPK